MIAAASGFTSANAHNVKHPIFLIEIDGYADKFTNYPTNIVGQRPWLIGLDDQSLTVSDLDGGADLGELTFTVQDRQGVLTASFPTFTFEGKSVTLKTGFVGMSQADFVTLFTGVVDSVASANNNLEYLFTCTDNKAVLNQVIFQTGNDGFPTSSDNPFNLVAHPLDILRAVLQGSGAGLLDAQIDIAKIESYRDGIFAGLEFEFSITTPPTIKDFIEQELLKPLGGYLWINNEGVFTVYFFYNAGATAVFDLTRGMTIDAPLASQSDLINQISFRFDKDSSTGSNGDFMSEAVLDYDVSIDLYGQYGAQVIESQGMRSAFQGFFQAAIASRVLFYRYGLKSLVLDPGNNEFGFIWKACLLEPGDIVTFTHDHIPDRAAGVMGITNKLFEVMDRTWKFSEGVVELKLLDASYLSKFGSYKIAPNGMAAYASASTLNKGKYMFLCNDSDQYSNGDAAHVLG